MPPQLKGLGTSHNSTFYGLADEAEAGAYLQHPVLGARYRESLAVVYQHLCKDRVEPLTLMGSDIDVMKLRSSLELFLKVSPADEESLRVRLGEILKILTE